MRPNIYASFLILIIIYVNKTSAQCPVTVDAGDDQFVCASGDQTTLNGSISGSYLGFAWTPAAGLDNPMDLTPNATVTGPMTYTLNGFAEDPSAPNLVTNPGFEAGNTGFSSSFSYTPVPITPGTYFIATSPTIVNANFPPCDDHTYGNGSGNMMILNGTGNPADVWCQVIPVTSNSYYVMSAWVTASPISPPTLQFSINGTLVGNPFNSSGGGCFWEQFSAAWFSDVATSALLCITDQSTSGNGLFGDDFALDDIYFAEACSDSDEVMVDVIEVEAVLPLFIELPCNALPGGIQLDGSASSTGPNITYQWSTGSGNIVSGGNTLTPTVNMEGVYNLTVTYGNGQTMCTDEASIEVLPDPNIVFAYATAPESINCINFTAVIDGGGSSSGPTISYEWSPLAGIISGETTQYPEVITGGVYTLIVTNSISGCTATTDVTVLEDTTQPTAAASAPGSLTCLNNTLTLSGMGSSSGGGFSYLWTASGGGHIVSGAITLNNCIVDEVGVYQLTVTNNANGCTDTDLVNVMGSFNLPTVAVEALDSIDCENQTAQISGNGSSSGNGISYLWTTDDGHIVSGATLINAVVDSGGIYVLTVTDSGSGCEASDTVVVFENTIAPLATIATPEPIGCMTDSLQLDGSGSSVDSVFILLWTTTNGLLLSGETGIQPFIGSIGEYYLTVTDTTNGCVSVDTTIVLPDTIPPIAEAGNPNFIGCDGSPVTLDGSDSSQGADFTYLWTTNGGNILSGETTLMPEINAAGTYFISITNSINGCQSVDSVLVTGDGNAPTAIASAPDTLNCLTFQLTIDASGSSSGTGLSISWTTVYGHIVSGETTLQPVVSEGGTYVLTISDTSGNCTSSTSVHVVQDTLFPQISIAPTNVLNCYQPIDALDATASSQGAIFSQIWTTSNGHIVSGETTLSPTIDSAGLYFLTIENTQNGCATTDSITVTANLTSPIANAGTLQTIDCTNQLVTLNGTGSSQGNPFSYLWTTVTGNLVSGQTTLTPTVNTAGTYILEVLNNDNGCSTTSEVTVEVQADFPQIDVSSLQGQLNCVTSELTLDASGTPNPDVTYLWTTQNGNITAGQTTLAPVVNAPGVYVLTATNAVTGCMASDSATITLNTTPPVADAGTPFTLPCGTPSVLLDGTGSSAGMGIVYQWTTQGGNIISGANTPTPDINAPGVYVLEVTDESTGCAETDTVVVNADGPLADAGLPDTLTCNSASLLLNGSGSDSGPGISYFWTTQNGNIVSGETTLTPEVNAAGTYLLTVTDMATNCQTIASVQVTDESSGPDISIANPPVYTCIDTIFNLLANTNAANPNWLWTTPDGNILSGETSPNPAVNAPGSYQLTVTDPSTGCTANTSVVVQENTIIPILNLAIPMQLTCDLELITLNGTGSSTGLNISYLWETNNGNIIGNSNLISTTVDEPGDYIFTVSDGTNGCTASAGITVLANTTEPLAVANAPTQLGCSQTQVSLDGTGTSTGSNFTYLWTTQDGNIVSGETSLSPVVDAPGQYILQVENTTNGCISSTAVTVTEDGSAPTLLILPPDELTCIDTVLTIDASGSSNGVGYQSLWTTANGNIVSGETDLTPVVDFPGTYILTITDTQNGCTTIDSIVVSENTTPPQATAGIDLTLDCDGSEIEIQGSLISPLNATFTWGYEPIPGVSGNPFVSGQQTSTPWVILPGTYTIVVTDPDNGCTFTDNMTVAPSGITGFSFEITNPDCDIPAGSINFTNVQGGNAPFTYSIDGNVFAPQMTFENLPPANYALTVQDADGCEATQDAQIIDFQEFEIVLHPFTTVILGSSISLNAQVTLSQGAIASIAWSPIEGLSCTDCLNPSAMPTSNTIYLLEVVDTNGCSAQASVQVMVSQPNIDVFVPNVFSPNGDGINDQLVIFANDQLVQQVEQFRIFDRWGGAVFEVFRFPPNDFNYGWDGTHQGQIMDGAVFVWLAEVVLSDGSKRLLEGEVLLLR